MKKNLFFPRGLFLTVAAVLLCLVVAGAPAQSNLIVRIHFAGADQISRDTNSATFYNEFCSPQAQALEKQTLDKLSRAPGIWYKEKIPAAAGDGSAQLRLLMDDFLKSEWIFEIRDAPASPEYALAIRLNANRAQLWLNSLNDLLESWTKIATKNIPGGWELKKDMPPNLFRITREGDWVVVGCGQDDLPLSDAWRQGGNIDENGTNWLSVNLDWPRLAQLFPVLAKFDFPAIEMQVVGADNNLLLNGQLNLSQPLLPLEAWEVPTNIIHPPLTSFTAARGFAPWLQKQNWASALRLSPEPNQAFVWSLGSMALQTFLCVPVPNATNALAQLGQNLSNDTNWEKYLSSPSGLDKSVDRILLANVPFAAPEILALPEGYGDFLFADVFPNTARGKAPPPELLQTLRKNNLVYYHWEITSERLTAFPQLTQLGLLLTRHRQLDGSSAASQWLNLIGPALGPSITEVIQTGPAELTFHRTATAGLTAFELTALANWLEAPNFPGCDLSIPALRFKPLHRPLKKLSAPAATPPGP